MKPTKRQEAAATKAAAKIIAAAMAPRPMPAPPLEERESFWLSLMAIARARETPGAN